MFAAPCQRPGSRGGGKKKKSERRLSRTPWSGLKCCQWQSDVPLNRITLKVSCHHIPASHYQGQAALWDDRERSGEAFPSSKTGPELPAAPDKRWERGWDDELLLVPRRRCLWNRELRGIATPPVSVAERHQQGIAWSFQTAAKDFLTRLAAGGR